MNVQDLRDELSTRAEERAPLSHGERLAAVRHKVAVRRRARTVGVVAVAAAALLAVLVPVATQAPTATLPDTPVVEPGRDTRGPLEFPEVVDADTLHVQQLGERGASTLRAEVSLPAGAVDLGVVCQAPRPPAGGRLAAYEVSVAIGGVKVYGADPCAPNATADGPMVSAAATPGAAPGEDVVVRMWLERDGERVQVPGAQLGFALWEQTGTDVVVAGQQLPLLQGVEGEDEQRLVQWWTEPVSAQDNRLQATLPAGAAGRTLSYGWFGPGGDVTVRTSGAASSATAGARVLTSGSELPDEGGPLVVTAAGASTGTLLLALYEDVPAEEAGQLPVEVLQSAPLVLHEGELWTSGPGAEQPVSDGTELPFGLGDERPVLLFAGLDGGSDGDPRVVTTVGGEEIVVAEERGVVGTVIDDPQAEGVLVEETGTATEGSLWAIVLTPASR